MKKHLFSLLAHPGKIRVALSALALGLCSNLQAAPVTWTAGTGNWSVGTNWSTTPSPPATSGDNLIFNIGATVLVSTVDSAWATAGSVTGLTFNGTGIGGIEILQGTGVTSLEIGSGGITQNNSAASGGNLTLRTGLNLIANAAQTWSRTNSVYNAGRFIINSNLSGNAAITLDPNAGRMEFSGGNSTGFTGSFAFNRGDLQLNGSSQLGRLGPNALTMGNTATSTLTLGNLSGANQALTFATPISFIDTGSVAKNFIVQSTVTGNSTLAVTGNWTGNLDDSLTLNSSNPSLLVRLQGNNTGLTSTKAGGTQSNSAIYLRNGIYSVENANTFGTGNSLNVSIGQHSGLATDLTGLRQVLYTNSGITVASPLYLNANFQSTADNARGSIITVGLQGTGNATFSGSTFTIQHSPTATTYGTTSQYRLPEVRLSAATGGAVTFSGQVLDSSTAATSSFAPVTVLGGGTVVLSGANNTYGGGTSIIAGTTLLANGGTGASGSTTGSGNVRVGYAAAAFTGTLTSGASAITGVSSTAGLVVGQTLTGTGIAAGTTITYIDASRSRVEISSNATSTGSQSLATNAETGILGGSGRIRPTAINSVQQQIMVANVSTIAPGNNAIGRLTVDGGGTSAALLTVASGAKFTFELDGSGGTPDQIDFWNYAGGDLGLNSNHIDLTLSGIQTAGLYTVSLFRFFNNAGATATSSGIMSGLNIGSVDASISGATVNYNAGGSTIDLTYTVIPEPSSFMLLGLGLAAMFSTRNRRR